MTWEKILPNNPFQEARVWKIVASAGCGKSYTVKKTIKALIADGVRPDEIMYLIFNKLPANEFKQSLSDVADDFPWIGTHHAVAKHLLNIPGDKILTGKTKKKFGEDNNMVFSGDDDDKPSLWDDVWKSLDLKIMNGDTNLDPYEKDLLNKLKQAESDHGFHSFTRMIEKSIVLNKIPPSVKYVFIDEGQDNSKIQFDYFNFIQSLPEIKGIMVVGDDKQAINLFKGGSPELFLGWEADRYVCLEETHRNSEKILAFANHIAEPIKERSPLTQKTASSAVGSVSYSYDLESAISMIRDQLKQKKSVYVLSRLNSYKFSAMAIMRTFNIPIESKAIERVKRIYLTMRELAEEGGLTFDRLRTILPSDEVESGELNKTAYWKRGALNKFLSGAYDQDKEPEAYAEYSQFWFDGLYEPDLTLLGFSPKFMEDVAATLKGKIPKDVWRGIDNDTITALEQTIQAYGTEYETVKVSTIHGVKGMECDTVVLLTNINKIVRNTESLSPDDERRVWYVGATRARENLIICPIIERNGLYTSII